MTSPSSRAAEPRGICFTAPPPEVPACRDVTTLAPRFCGAVLCVLHRMKEFGHDPVIAETLRTNERQQYLYGFGRDYDDGRHIVTHSRNADETWHGFGLAVDIISQAMQWDAPTQFWLDLQASAEAEGLASGRSWELFKDNPHIQWGPPMRRSPSPNAARLFASGGYEAVWREVGALSSPAPLSSRAA